MIDFILFCFMVAAFWAGFRCGKTFGSFKAMIASAKARVNEWLTKA